VIDSGPRVSTHRTARLGVDEVNTTNELLCLRALSNAPGPFTRPTPATGGPIRPTRDPEPGPTCHYLRMAKMRRSKLSLQGVVADDADDADDEVDVSRSRAARVAILRAPAHRPSQGTSLFFRGAAAIASRPTVRGEFVVILRAPSSLPYPFSSYEPPPNKLAAIGARPSAAPLL
jgi:hypothetical protein